MLRNLAWYVGLIMVLAQEMACHTQCTTEATPLRWEHSLGALLISRSIFLPHLTALSNSKPFPKERERSSQLRVEVQAKEDQLSVNKIKQAKKKQESCSELHSQYLLYRQDLGFCFQFPPALHGCIKVSHLREVVHGTRLCSEEQQQENAASFPNKIKHCTTALD